MDIQEQWLPIDGEDFIEVSSIGRVRTVDRVVAICPQSKNGRITGNLRSKFPSLVLSPWINHGYQMISFRVDGKKYRRYVHRLVAKAFVGGEFPGATVDHLDGDRTHNLPANLEWVTLSENSKRQNQSGRGVGKGENHPCAKLANSQIPEIKKMRECGMSYNKIGATLGVSGSLIHKIVAGKRRGSE